MKKLLSYILIFAMVLSLLPAVALPRVQAATQTPAASEIRSLFEARSQDVHPRIMANADDFARIRKLVQTDPYMQMWYGRIYNHCLTLLDEPLCVYELPDGKRLLNVCNEATWRITWLAMAYQISGEDRFAKRAVEEMINVCAFKDWNPTHYLDTAQMSYGVGLGYDWLYHYMSTTERNTVREGLYKNGIATQDPPPNNAMQKVNNWNPWCNGGISVGAAAVFEDYPEECATILSNAVKNLPLSFQYAPSGSYPEGPGYYIIGISYTVFLIDTLFSILGTDFGLSEAPGVKESGSYLLAINGNLTSFNFGDGGSTLRDSAMLHWFANYYNMPELSLFQRDYQTTNSRFDEYLALLWYNPQLVESMTSEDRPLDHLLMSDYYESIASFRSFPGEEAQIYTAIKSGDNQTGHTDLDVGTFVMEAIGELWFMDLGKDNYNLPDYMDRTENGGRWQYYRTRAEGQNTLVINPDSTGGQVFNAQCQITDYESAYDGGYAIVDMLDAYDNYGVKSARRSLALFDNRTRVRLRDEINCSSASTIYWFAHTQADISISADGKTATLTQNGKTLLAQIASPTEAKFTQMDATPLPTSPNPDGQDPNTGIRKLVIKLTNTTSASITVFFTPVLSEGTQSNSLPTYGITNTYKLLKHYDPATTLEPNAEGIYEIRNAEQLCLLSDLVAQGNSFAGKTIVLTQDIDMKGRSIQPIGGNDTGYAFSGTFDGRNHVIKDLEIFEPKGVNVGLFGKVSGGTIRNLGIDSGLVTGGKATGSLIGVGNNVTVENSFARCNVICTNSFGGGLVGQTGGTSSLTNSYHTGYVKATNNTAGGIIGYISSVSVVSVENCYHSGDLWDNAGKIGLIGHYNSGDSSPITSITVKNSYSTTALKGSGIIDNSALETYTDSKTLTPARMVSAAVSLGDGFIYDCEWENGGYPVLFWECDTTLPQDLVLTTAAELRLLAYLVNSGTDNFSGKTITLGNDIDLESRQWTPIGGNNSEDSAGNIFRGTFDGQGYSVANVYISTGYNYVGFFGNVTGTIRNFGVKSGSIHGGNKTGGLTGYIAGTISSCYSRATVSGTTHVGGLAGMGSKARISDSYAVATVTATGNAGGLVGYFSSAASYISITDSYTACALSGKVTGALVANIHSSVTDIVVNNSYGLKGPSLLGSAPAATLENSSTLSEAELKTIAGTLGIAFCNDDAITKNGGYPVLTSTVYKTANMQSLAPNEEGIYEISTVSELRRLSYMVNVLGETFDGKTVRLMSDLDLESEEWIPIGGNANVSGGACVGFRGTFQGGGHKIRNLAISAGNYYVGFFGRLDGAQIYDLGIDGGIILGASRVGGLVGVANSNSHISGCYNKANVYGQTYIGGIAGMAGGENTRIENCYNTGSIGGTKGNGGIAGYLGSSAHNLRIQNCYNLGSANAGIVSLLHTTATCIVDTCYSADSTVLTGTGGTTTVSNSSVLSLQDLRSSASLLGASFAEDYFTQNKIFPVLRWENGTRSTTLPETDGIYTIHTADQLRLLSYEVRKGNTFKDKTIDLCADLDLGSVPWFSIGGKDESSTYYFCGTFRGNGHVITGLNATDLDQGYTGLFGCIKDATIRDLGIENGIVIGKTRAAALAAYVHNRSTIQNCYNKAMVYANTDTGALAAIIAGSNVQIRNCYNTGSVFAKKFTNSTGGLIGYIGNTSHNFTMENCYNVGNFYGLIGKVGTAENAVVRNSYSVGTVALCRTPADLSFSDSAQVGKATLKSYAAVLGSAYESDIGNMNKGYPVLTWENAPEIKEPVLDESLKIGHTLNLASDISVNFAVSKSLLAGYDMDTVYLETVLPVYEGNVQIGSETIRLLPTEQGNYYYFTLTGLTAVHMNNRLSSVLYGAKDGQVYCSATDDYSIADYAYSQMNKSNMPQSLKVLCADLLRYGGAAQIFKSYRTDSLADSAMTEAHRAFLSDIESVTFGNNNAVLNDLDGATITWAGKALDLNSKVSLKFIFSLGSYTGSVEDLSLRVSYENYGGQMQPLSLTGAELYNSDRGLYAFTFDGLLAAELRAVVSAQVYAGNTPVSATLQYSADTYGNNKTGTLLDLCKALFAYSDSAKAYFAG